MGMDVIGNNPTTDKGEYFRNNVWWWRPLWEYCCEAGEKIISDDIAQGGHFNDGVGLDADGALALGNLLLEEIAAGRTVEYESRYNAFLASLDRTDCDLCDATGIRADEVGVEAGMPEKELSSENQILTGRMHGWCNACDGVGTREAWALSYPFSIDNVRNFAEFCKASGGFEIC
jgi:hypothetical protein